VRPVSFCFIHHLIGTRVMSTKQEPPETEPLLVTVVEVARLLSVSQRHVLGLHKNELMPKSIRLGHSTRWNINDIRRWIAAGCPDRKTWESMK